MILKFAKRYLPPTRECARIELICHSPSCLVQFQKTMLSNWNYCIYRIILPEYSSHNYKANILRLAWKCKVKVFFKLTFRFPTTPQDTYCLLDLWTVGQVIFAALFRWKESSWYSCKRTAFADTSFKLNFTKWRRINFLSSHFNNTQKFDTSPFN